MHQNDAFTDDVSWQLCELFNACEKAHHSFLTSEQNPQHPPQADTAAPTLVLSAALLWQKLHPPMLPWQVKSEWCFPSRVSRGDVSVVGVLTLLQQGKPGLQKPRVTSSTCSKELPCALAQPPSQQHFLTCFALM